MDLSIGLRRWQIVSAILALFGLADSLYLWSTKLGTKLVCGVGDCDVVNASPYASLLGIPVAALGAVGYAVLIALALWALYQGEDAPAWLTDMRLLLAFGGVLFSAYLSAVEVFILHTI